MLDHGTTSLYIHGIITILMWPASIGLGYLFVRVAIRRYMKKFPDTEPSDFED